MPPPLIYLISLAVNLAQLVSTSVALPAELVGHIFGHIMSGKYGHNWSKWTKMAKMTITAWPDMAKNMANMGFHAMNRTNVDHQ